MCDTLVIRRNGRTLFAKNSDREPGEAQLVVHIPPVDGDKSGKLTATHITIDQTANRHGVIVSKPGWIWGAEMGANDRGVVIGNEAVFTRVMEKADGLIGMDLVRLGLERGDTAEDALHIIVKLLEKHGQGGVCGFRDKRFRYDNSFIIADSTEAWVLETAGRHWVAKRAGDAAAISNCLSIGADYDLKSDGLEDFAKARGLYKGKAELDFRLAFESPLLPFLAKSNMRRQTLLGKTRGFRSSTIDSDLFAMMSLLRTHQYPLGVPAKGSNADICMHAAGPVRRSQTCGSMVTLLEKNHGRPSMHRALHFFTGTSAPCLSVFKPAAMTAGENTFHVLNPDGHTIEGSLWRRFEPVHRHALFSADLRNEVRRTAAEAEREMRAILDRMDQPGNPSDTDMLKAAEAPVRDWTEKWINHAAKRQFSYSLTPYAWYWKRQNRLDGMA